jgi:hypothetical protein
MARDQRGEILVCDLARQQQQYQDAETKGGSEATLRPATRPNHPLADPNPH